VRLDPLELVRAFLAEYTPPLKLWLAPEAHERFATPLQPLLPPHATCTAVPCEALPPGPAILLATDRDLAGPHRASLLELQRAALPGRPVVSGGSGNRDVLLDAINTWQVFHLLPERSGIEEIADAVTRAQRSCALEHATLLCAEHLRGRCDELSAILEELQQTREQLLQAERMSTVSGFSRALRIRLRAHLASLHELERALSAQRDDPRSAELLDFTMQSIHGIETLLAELLKKAGAGEATTNP
jgi:hypothetical protein